MYYASTDHTDPGFITDRQYAIDLYLRALLDFPYISENPDFTNFICPDAEMTIQATLSVACDTLDNQV